MLKPILQILKAFKYSLDGLREILKERAFRQELLLIVFLLPTLLFFSLSHIELILMVLSLILILIVEVINSAVEAVVDRISEEIHPLSKKAKDLGSLAVLLSFINFMFTWGIILI